VLGCFDGADTSRAAVDGVRPGDCGENRPASAPSGLGALKMERRAGVLGTQLTPETGRCFESQAHQGPDDGVPPWNYGKFVLSAAFFLNEWLRIGARPFGGDLGAANGRSSERPRRRTAKHKVFPQLGDNC
jgi:hypothetical protein